MTQIDVTTPNMDIVDEARGGHFQPTVDVLAHPGEAINKKLIDAEERPVLREFGNPAAIAKAVNASKHANLILPVCALLVAGVGAFLVMHFQLMDSAPAFNTVKTEIKASPTPLTASAPAASAPEPASLATDPVALVALDVNTLPSPKTLEEAKSQIHQMKEKVALLRKDQGDAMQQIADMEQKVEQVTMRAKPILKLTLKTVVHPQNDVEYVPISVLDINADRVLVTEASRPSVRVEVQAGAQFPGGAMFIGYDADARLMKTDQGDFPIR